MTATLTRPTRRTRLQTETTRPVSEMLRELAFRLHATRAVRVKPPVLKPR